MGRPAQAVAATESGRGGLGALGNGIAVLRCFSPDRPLLGVSEVAETTGLHKSTVSRILSVLESESLVERDATSRKFTLGIGVLGLAAPLLAGLDVRRVARPVLSELRESTGETAALMLWTGSASVCVEQEPSHHEIKHTMPIGMRYTTAWSASVQAFLSTMPDQSVRARIESGAIELPDGNADALLAHLDRARAAGMFVNHRRTAIDVVGVAALVYDLRADVAGAVLVAAPSYRQGPERIALLQQTVAAAARTVSQRLGHLESTH